MRAHPLAAMLTAGRCACSQIDHTLTTGQRVRVVPPLVVMEGQHVALVNLKGPLKVS